MFVQTREDMKGMLYEDRAIYAIWNMPAPSNIRDFMERQEKEVKEGEDEGVEEESVHDE